jgi:hypothetical protein
MEENTTKNSTFNNLKKIFNKEKPNFTAEYAWLETSYGSGTFSSLEERIKSKQNHITNQIKANFPTNEQHYKFANVNTFYHCVVNIEEDLMCCVDDVFRPFIEGGFKVINISQNVKELEDENIYLISWKKIFKEKHSNLTPKEDGREGNENL